MSHENVFLRREMGVSKSKKLNTATQSHGEEFNTRSFKYIKKLENGHVFTVSLCLRVKKGFIDFSGTPSGREKDLLVAHSLLNVLTFERSFIKLTLLTFPLMNDLFDIFNLLFDIFHTA